MSFFLQTESKELEYRVSKARNRSVLSLKRLKKGAKMLAIFIAIAKYLQEKLPPMLRRLFCKSSASILCITCAMMLAGGLSVSASQGASNKAPSLSASNRAATAVAKHKCKQFETTIDAGIKVTTCVSWNAVCHYASDTQTECIAYFFIAKGPKVGPGPEYWLAQRVIFYARSRHGNPKQVPPNHGWTFQRVGSPTLN